MDFWVHLDESGKQATAPYFFLLGYMGSARQWLQLKRGWKAVLRIHGVAELHAHEFFHRQRSCGSGPFDGWPADKATAFLNELARVLASVAIYPIGAAVDITAFNSHPKGDRRFLTGAIVKHSGKWKTMGKPSDPYLLMFQWVIKDALERTSRKQTVHLMCDSQPAVEGNVHQRFNEIKETEGWLGRGRLGNLAFADSAKEPGLQAADLRNYVRQREFAQSGEISDELASVAGQIARPNEVLQTFGKKELDEILGKVNASQRRVQQAEL